MVQFLSKIFLSWISSIFVGFFKSSRFLCHPVCVCVCVCVCKYVCMYVCISVGNKLRVYQTVPSFTEFLFTSVLFLRHVLFTLKDTKFSAVHMCVCLTQKSASLEKVAEALYIPRWLNTTTNIQTSQKQRQSSKDNHPYN